MVAVQFVTQSQAEVGVLDRVSRVRRKNIRLFVQQTKRGRDLSLRRAGSQGRLSPLRGIFRAVAIIMLITEFQLRPVFQRQAALEERGAAVHEQVRVGWRERKIEVGQVAAAAVVVLAILPESGAHITDVRMLDVELQVIIVIVKNPAAIHREQPLLCHRFFKMKSVDAAKRSARRQARLFLVLRLIPAHHAAAHADVHPVDQ